MSHRAARGFAYQGGLKEWGQSPSIVDVSGTDLLGLPLKAPNAVYETVYTLPLLTISMSKGTVSKHLMVAVTDQVFTYMLLLLLLFCRVS